jgi:hypothetical protein
LPITNPISTEPEANPGLGDFRPLDETKCVASSNGESFRFTKAFLLRDGETDFETYADV